ncbi:hypothetical protein EIP91_001748 [Steccherinum ochraceum]|uniref:Uncharacterized protein n=1 Tax=Steccherinum ochraceum TaxID=92696 RepID=A0A4R0RFR8_9APHY|nr:hypothetical protein EIP91_001748 [Steccherinum ochraceum]
MFTRFAALFVYVLVFIGATLVGAAPMHQHVARQIGDLQCNIDRLKIVGDIFQASQTTKTLTNQLASDPANAALVSTVSKGLSDASAGIGDIATALFTGQQAPAASRTQVEDGLNSAFTAADSITSTNAAVTDNVNKLKNELQAAGQAGDGVLTNCN